ncbi:Hypothetical protein, putative [Bodo saltans]|uniref:Uncharacterized protein n=1 Tax=Bodo saltans TaxID=75058 RepID=A0A0S4J1Y9_BODSA|nr:Hypothetical protein, putative [Bodo saltans]|eukprot:CUG13890.1 Hypothetical protein, putative [Bodo saltans]
MGTCCSFQPLRPPRQGQSGNSLSSSSSIGVDPVTGEALRRGSSVRRERSSASSSVLRDRSHSESRSTSFIVQQQPQLSSSSRAGGSTQFPPLQQVQLQQNQSASQRPSIPRHPGTVSSISPVISGETVFMAPGRPPRIKVQVIDETNDEGGTKFSFSSSRIADHSLSPHQPRHETEEYAHEIGTPDRAQLNQGNSPANANDAAAAAAAASHASSGRERQSIAHQSRWETPPRLPPRSPPPPPVSLTTATTNPLQCSQRESNNNSDNHGGTTDLEATGVFNDIKFLRNSEATNSTRLSRVSAAASGGADDEADISYLSEVVVGDEVCEKVSIKSSLSTAIHGPRDARSVTDAYEDTRSARSVAPSSTTLRASTSSASSPTATTAGSGASAHSNGGRHDHMMIRLPGRLVNRVGSTLLAAAAT